MTNAITWFAYSLWIKIISMITIDSITGRRWFSSCGQMPFFTVFIIVIAYRSVSTVYTIWVITLDVFSAIFVISIKSIPSSSLTIKIIRVRARSTIFAGSVIWITISTGDSVRLVTPALGNVIQIILLTLHVCQTAIVTIPESGAMFRISVSMVNLSIIWAICSIRQSMIFTLELCKSTTSAKDQNQSKTLIHHDSSPGINCPH